MRLQNEYRLLKEKSALEVEELQTINARLRADVMGVEHNLNIMTVSWDDSIFEFVKGVYTITPYGLEVSIAIFFQNFDLFFFFFLRIRF